jgi:hypothetical protein
MLSGEQRLRVAATAQSLSLISGFGNNKQIREGTLFVMRTTAEFREQKEATREAAFSLGILTFMLALQ